jgi:hypothetical protein
MSELPRNVTASCRYSKKYTAIFAGISLKLYGSSSQRAPAHISRSTHPCPIEKKIKIKGKK